MEIVVLIAAGGCGGVVRVLPSKQRFSVWRVIRSGLGGMLLAGVSVAFLWAGHVVDSFGIAGVLAVCVGVGWEEFLLLLRKRLPAVLFGTAVAVLKHWASCQQSNGVPDDRKGGH